MHAPGTLIGGRHRIEALLGRGGFGVVYRATQLALDRPVALKVLLPEALGDEALPRFQREAEIVQRLDHPNIVRLLDFGVGAGAEPYLVFELLQGQTLHEALASAGPLSVARAARVGAQILKALMEAHARGVVHRDIKPANVFLCNFQGEPDFVKVLDFGIAKGRDSGTLTGRGGVLGTPAYMAPEQANGGVVGFAADLFSLGLMLEEMLTGKAVYGGMSLVDIVREHVSASAVPHAASALSSPLGPIIHRATSKRAELRYPSAGEMLAHLEAAMSYATASGQVAPSSTGATPPNIAHAPTAQPGAMAGYPSRVLVPTPPKARSRQRALPWKALAAAGGGVVLIGALVAAAAALTGGRPREPRRAAATSSASAQAPAAIGLTAFNIGARAFEVSANGDATPDLIGLCGDGPAGLCVVDGATFQPLWRKAPDIDRGAAQHHQVGGVARVVVHVDTQGIMHFHDAATGAELSAVRLGTRADYLCAPDELPGKLWVKTTDDRGVMVDTLARTTSEGARPASCGRGRSEHICMAKDPRVCARDMRHARTSEMWVDDLVAEGASGVLMGRKKSDSAIKLLAGFDARAALAKKADSFASEVVQTTWQRPIGGNGGLDAVGTSHFGSLNVRGGRAVAAYDDARGKHHVFALDAATGRALWDIVTPTFHDLTISATRVYLRRWTRVEAYDAATGRLLGGAGERL